LDSFSALAGRGRLVDNLRVDLRNNLDVSESLAELGWEEIN
jgi:hypothetical protein